MQAHKRPGQSLLKGTLVLTAAGIVVKIIGSLNWVILSRVLGGEGMGLYQMAYPLYFLALSVSSAGIPVAISIITAERVAAKDHRGARRVFRVSLLLLAATGLFFSLLLFFGASWLIEERFIRDPRAYYSLIALSPAIFFVTILSSFRGFLQGWQIMTPTAVSQIAEQVVRVITMLIFATWFASQGIEYAAAGATFGAAPGAVAGLVIILAYYWRQRALLAPHPTPDDTLVAQPTGEIIRRIFRLSLPISVSSVMLPIVANLDLFIVPLRLERAGYTVEAATELFGYLTGMAVPLVNLATVLTGALATSIVPAVSEAYALGSREMLHRRTAAGFRLANIVTFPAFVGVWTLAAPLSMMLYHAPQAAPAVNNLSWAIVLLGIHQVSTGVLQGMGRTFIPVINMTISAAAKVALNWFLTALPALGIIGAAWATVADIGIAALLNVYYVRRYTGFSFDYPALAKSALSAVVMGGAVFVTHRFLVATVRSNNLATMLAIAVGVVVYGLCMLYSGGIKEADVKMVPLIGGPLRHFLKRLRLLPPDAGG